MPSSVTVNIYLGAGLDGAKLLERIEKHCDRQNLSVSEYVKSLILKDLAK